MALDHKPLSDSARKLCAMIANALAFADEKRKYGRGAEKQKEFERAIGAVVADLLLAIDENKAEGWAYRPSRAGSFTDEAVSFRTYTSVMKPAATHKLVDMLRGYREPDKAYDTVTGEMVDFPSAPGLTNRYRATPALLQLAEGFGITPATVDAHFLQSIPRHPLVLREASSWDGDDKVSGKRIDFDETDHTKKLEADLHELNQFMDAIEITGGVHRGYRRIFNQGDQPGFAWNKGGRLYSQGRTSYQQAPSSKRIQMTFNGEPVAEIDITASFLVLLHGLKGMTLERPEDPYTIWKHIPRAVVKTWVTMTLGYHQFHSEWPKDALERLAVANIEPHPIAQVGPVILKYLPILKDWPEQELTVFDLMFHESEAMLATMLALMRDHRVPSLSVHDSIIVPRSAVAVAEGLLKQHYRQQCGIEPALKVSHSKS